MKLSILHTFGWFSLLTLISSIPQPTTAQPITPAADGTGTRITPDGQRYDIDGGTLSPDGANLFHSFQKFGLDQGQTANFISNPQIHNILGRVVGGDPSIINGLIQITGGNSNLFLMNPAGILFGPNASLNIPADFTATTASGIGFGNSWFNAFGSNDYANLVGTPSAFSFNMSQLGTIINEGNLTLTPGSNLNLFANTVINTGTLATPGGNINITAVPNGNTLRISQPGHILSLEIDTQKPGLSENRGFLAELLTGGDPIHHATTVEKLQDGTIRLSGSQTPIPIGSGVAVVGGNLEIGDRNRVSQQNLDINPINLAQKPGFLNILGDKIALIGANIDASGTNGAGNIHIGGNYQGAGPLPNATHTYIDTNTNITANAISGGNGGEIIIWSDNTTQFHGNISATGIENGGFVEVSGKQNLIFRGNVDLSAPNGQTGTLLLDPQNITIVDGSGGADDSQLSDNQILFSDDPGTTYTISETTLESLDGNAAVELQATNNITIEDLTTDNQLTFQSGTGAITFTADADNDGNGAFIMIDPGDFITAPGRPFTINAATITLANIETNSMFGSGGDITLNATGDIIAGNILSSGDSQAGAINITSSGGQINLSPLGWIYSGSLFGSPGNITLKAAGNITTGVIIASNVVNPGTGTVNPGHITIESTGGAIDTTAGFLQSTADGSSSGNIQLKAAGDIRTGNIDSYGLWAGTGGSISLESTGGIIDTSLGVLNSFSTFGVAGEVTLKAAGDITTGNIMSNSGQQGGNITITSITGLINAANGDLSSNSLNGNGGNVTLEAAGNIVTKNIMSFGAIVGGNVTVNSGGSFSSSEGISTYASDLISSGVGGNVDIHAGSDITLGTNGSLTAISSIGEQQGGSITITSDTGKITANAGIFLSSDSGTAGDVTLDAPGNIDITNILSFGGTKGGSVSITSDTTIDVYAIDSYSETGQGGDVSIIAEGNITLSGDFFGNTIRSEGPQQGGSIRITSNTGEINATAGNLNSYSINGTAGNVTLESAGNIATTNIRSQGALLGGNVTVNSGGSFSNSEGILSYASDAISGVAGNVDIHAGSDITLGTNAIFSAISSTGEQQGGSITITSDTGKITANADIFLSSQSGTAGDVTLDAPGNIDITNILSFGGTKGGSISITSDSNIDFTGSTLNSYSATGQGGDVSIIAEGDITLGGDVGNSAIRSDGSQQGGNISITSNTGEIKATAGNLNSDSTNGTAGNVTLEAAGNIATKNIISFGAITGGNVTVNSGGSFSNSELIFSYASDTTSGVAGNVDIHAGSDITLGTNTISGTIQSTGGQQGGSITITSDTGKITGNASIFLFSDSGTAGDATLDAPGNIDIANILSFGGTKGGSISITSDTSLDFTGSTLNSYSANGQGGDVSIIAEGNITLGGNASNSAIRSEGSLVGGNISITTNNGKINATAGNLDSYSTNGTAGNVMLDATGNISTSNIRSQGAFLGGSIEITTGGSFTTNGTINSYASNVTTGNAGNVNITANSDITLGGDVNNSAIRSEGATVGGNISISSSSGAINANAGNLDSYSAKGTAGSVNLDAATGIDIANIRSEGDMVGGSINITSDTNLDFTGSTLNSYSQTGAAGDVSITADGNITLGGDASNSAIRSEGATVGGNISITTNNGEINATAGNLDSYSTNGMAGNVMLDATGNIATSNIRSQGAFLGGNIDIITGGGFTTIGTINSYASNTSAGNAGDVNVTANSDITLGGDANNSAIRSEGATVGGNISISSSSGAINANSGNLDSYSAQGTAGSVNLDAATGIDIANIRSEGDTVGGSINITSDTSLDFTGSTLNSYSQNGEAGDVSITANGHITLGGDASNSAIRSEGSLVGGNISITSNTGEINATAGNLDSYSTNGTAGNVMLDATGNIATSNIRSQGASIGGNIDITTGGGFTTIGTINSYASNATAGEAGDVSITANSDITLDGDANNSAIRSEGATVGGNISITSNNGEINANGGNLDSYSAKGTAGSVNLDAATGIDIANIRSDGDTKGGSINITSDTSLDFTGSTLNSYSETGQAGDVNIIAEGNITLGGDANNSAIRSEGSLVGGNISITTNNGEIDATAGNLDSYSTNGMAGNVALESAGNIATSNIRSQGAFLGGNIDINTGGTFTTTGTINSYASNATTGEAGDVNITANSDITLGGDANNSAIRSEGATVGGNISISSTSGEINATAGNLDSYSTNGMAGNVILESEGNIATQNIRSEGALVGGNINITTGGTFTTTGTINSYASDATTGKAGDVNVTANGNITLGGTPGGDVSNSAIRSEGSLVGGNISITSNNGEINATAGNLDSYSTNGMAGNVALESAGNIATSNIRSQGAFLGGNIDINTGGTFTTTGTINSYASDATAAAAGDVNITADGDITLGGDANNSAIRSEGSQLGGNINITTNTGEIDATAGNLDSYSINGTAGNVTLESARNIATSNIRSEGASVGGNIDITTGGTFTTTGTINSYASNATTGEAGDVNITANSDITLGGDASNSAIRSEGSQLGGNISITSTSGEIDATAGNLDSYSINGTAGNVTLESAGNIATASIRSDGQQTGGIISITSNGGAIDTTGGDLSSYSDSGTAGNVILNAGGGSVTTGNIDSKSPRLGGSITITSAGDLDTSLGDLLSFSTGGTAGDITLKAAGCVTTGDIRTDGAQIAGTLSITSCTCAIDTSLGTLTTYSTNGTAGDVILDALNGVTTGDITSYGNTSSGHVNIQSDSGNISTNHIQTISPNGVAGNVTLNTFSHNGDILTANITSQGGTLAGDISVKAPDGSIKTGDIASISQSGDAGDIDVSAGEDVETGDITSSGGNNSGNINVNSDNGGVTTENVATIAKNGNSGDVALGAWEQILTGDITSAAGENSGDINVSSSNAGVTTEDIATVAQNGDSGNVTVGALDNVQTGNITSAAGNNSGDINVSSSNGGVTTENLITVAQNGDSGNVGVGALDDIQTGDITSVAGNNSADISVNSDNGGVAVGNLESGAVNGDSANIFLSGFGDVTAGDISSVAGGNSGDILVNSTTAGIVAGDIESQAASGMGGNISFDADQNINTGWIISNGSQGSGDINLTSANGTITTGEIYTATGKININYPGQVDSRNMLANLAAASGGSSIVNADAVVASLEQSLTDEYSEYFGGNLAQKLHTTASIRESLNKIAAETGYKSAIVYVMAQQDQLELILFLGTGNVIRKAVPEAPREQLMATVEKFRQQLTVKRLGKRTNGYLQASQQLYQWLITPIEAELQAAGINTLLFSMDAGLRSLPIAALHDGNQFLVEKYSMSLIPSMSLIDPRYQHLKDTRVLGMGASHFQNLGPLPAVPVELSAVTEDLWQGDDYLNETFTRDNLVEQRQNNPYPIIHLATHGEFQPGLPENSYIQLWGEDKLRLNQLRELGWNNPPVELLVLSACRTALGDEQAELGFAGFAVAAGVKSALASLWYVSDEGSLALMTEFYRNLEAAKIKGEALRQAQLAMIRGEVDVTGGSLRNSAVGSAIVLPPELAGVENHELSHPYYWSAFTMIGSPW